VSKRSIIHLQRNIEDIETKIIKPSLYQPKVYNFPVTMPGPLESLEIKGLIPPPKRWLDIDNLDEL
jgi:hypothetical protein